MTQTAPLSDAEVAERCKVSGFGAYLQVEWIVYPDLKKKLAEGTRPTKAELAEIVDRMARKQRAFDYSYLWKLPDLATTALQDQQAAWRDLSPRIRDFIGKFRAFIEHYPSDETWERELARQIEVWWSLLQEWNAISVSYKQIYS